MKEFRRTYESHLLIYDECAEYSTITTARTKKSRKILFLFDIFFEKRSMEVISYGVINESFLDFWFSSRLVTEHDVIVPLSLYLRRFAVIHKV